MVTKVILESEFNEYKGSAYLDFRDGKEFIYEWAVLELLANEILFVGLGKTGYEKTILYVCCNDIFAWGTADGEDIPAYELKNLYKMWKDDPKWGVTKWCCIHRNVQPQAPVARDMEKDGVWDEIMKKLPANSFDKLGI